MCSQDNPKQNWAYQYMTPTLIRAPGCSAAGYLNKKILICTYNIYIYTHTYLYMTPTLIRVPGCSAAGHLNKKILICT